MAHIAMEWVLGGGIRMTVRPIQTWRETFKEEMELNSIDAKPIAIERSILRKLVARCPKKEQEEPSLSK